LRLAFAPASFKRAFAIRRVVIRHGVTLGKQALTPFARRRARRTHRLVPQRAHRARARARDVFVTHRLRVYAIFHPHARAMAPRARIRHRDGAYRARAHRLHRLRSRARPRGARAIATTIKELTNRSFVRFAHDRSSSRDVTGRVLPRHRVDNQSRNGSGCRVVGFSSHWRIRVFSTRGLRSTAVTSRETA